ncbi:MAG: hypothetical protein MZV63_50330 [Marinilabiliales bacterium]|nr:hypothetical protein [Marinilabiliales bacterium]
MAPAPAGPTQSAAPPLTSGNDEAVRQDARRTAPLRLHHRYAEPLKPRHERQRLSTAVEPAQHITT